MSRPVYLTSTGNAGNAGGGVLSSIGIAATGAAAGVATVRENGSGGSIIMDLAAPAAGSFQYFFDNLVYNGQLHVTITGAGVTVVVEVE